MKLLKHTSIAARSFESILVFYSPICATASPFSMYTSLTVYIFVWFCLIDMVLDKINDAHLKYCRLLHFPLFLPKKVWYCNPKKCFDFIPWYLQCISAAYYIHGLFLSGRTIPFRMIKQACRSSAQHCTINIWSPGPNCNFAELQTVCRPLELSSCSAPSQISWNRPYNSRTQGPVFQRKMPPVDFTTTAASI